MSGHHIRKAAENPKDSTRLDAITDPMIMEIRATAKPAR